MLRKLAASLAILCLVGPSLAQNVVQLAPRVPYSKKPNHQIVLPAEGDEIRLIVKFHDNLRVRATADERVVSLANHDMGNVLDLAAQTGVTFRKAINHSLDKLATLQNRAGALSKRGQPDLGGIMYVDGDKDVILQVARTLNAMDSVEYVEFEPVWIPHQAFNKGNGKIEGTGSGADKDDGTGGGPLAGGGGIACGDPFATPCDTADDENPFCNDVLCCEAVCLIDPDCCEEAWDDACVNWAAEFCPGLPVLECGAPVAGSCFTEHVLFHHSCDDFECCEIVCDINPYCCETTWDLACANAAIQECVPQCGDFALGCFEPHPPGSPLCEDPDCCSAVCSLDPFCCSTTWDLICSAIAYNICPGGDACGNQFNGTCITPHGGLGCRYEDCCAEVCDIDPNCCTIGWDVDCADMAEAMCSTPDFTQLQGYKTIDWYFDNFGRNPPQGLAFPAPSAFGFTGEGHDMPGLWDFGEFILGLGNGDENLTRGKGARIGVIEHSAWVDHEDLINKVILEPGQTIIHMEGVVISSNHGTATLGIVVAEDNGFGITGMAPQAQGYFFPIVSVEEGGRIISAMTAALLVFEHGDVLSYSIGPGGGTLDSTFSTNLMLRISSDLGIISCISAGNDCVNLDDDDTGGNELPDSGAVTVGAGFPGVPWCRLGFSNHGNCIGRVHCQSWGAAVTTTGYGALFNPSPDEPQRHYTNDFGGTSAAAPIIAGLAADLQGIAKMFYGIPLMPEQIRGVMAGSGFPQCLADPCEQGVMPGAEDGEECGGDPSLEEAPNAIGFFPDPPTCAEAIIITSWFDSSPFIDDIEILRGTLVSGNAFSIKASDNNRLVIKSQFTHPNDNQGLGINYLATGQVTDLLVHAHIDDLTQPFVNLLITSERHQSDVPFICDPGGNIPSANGLTFYEMWNWITQKWEFIIFDPAAGTDCNISPPQNTLVLAPHRFVRQTDGKMQLRVWTLSLGGNFGGFGGGGTQPYFVRHDHINIRTTGLSGAGTPTPP
ncbi:MAG: S8 family serine peptidase [Planctomycetes bacterium]|nr:S8 family serine peptidase [Planctomycetota bacterium]